MRRALAAVLLTLGMIVIPAGTATAAAGCSASSSKQVSGGYRVTLFCSGKGYVDGYGSTLTDANREALLLYQIYTDHGIDCTGSSIKGVTGGHRTTLWCSRGGYIDGYGSTLTDAASEARELVLLMAITGKNCTGSSTRGVSGGYEVTLWCSRGGYIDGVGTFLTDAARNARFAATIS
ncbi:hypothetical protein JOF56_010940 [Kibdelosporangium banguiense]|uniref:Serine/threonine protein kinase n=1 Tax=Kibdelosporangium banguiense TaxID=1365924 RepID=A0ABS4U1N0_9PSEU|nr:hypothetical protein [Kibdelosporangium banguiense]MBP2330555.1 hypothetical protein [Kibdelosporangium banguiense]